VKTAYHLLGHLKAESTRLDGPQFLRGTRKSPPNRRYSGVRALEPLDNEVTPGGTVASPGRL